MVSKAARQQYIQALELLVHYAKSHGAAACALATLYETGQGVTKNEHYACCWYKRGFELGDQRHALELLENFAKTSIEAQYTCGELYLTPSSNYFLFRTYSTTNEPKALSFFDKAARAKHYYALEKMKALAQRKGIDAVPALRCLPGYI